MKKYGSPWEVLCELFILFSYFACPYGAYKITTTLLGNHPVVQIIAVVNAILSGTIYFYRACRTEDFIRDAERSKSECKISEHREIQAVNDLSTALSLLTEEQRNIYYDTRKTIVFDEDCI